MTPSSIAFACWSTWNGRFRMGVELTPLSRSSWLLTSSARRLAMKPTEALPLFSREFLIALEDLVLDPFLPHAQRVAAGKLRLCIQSSTRYDDIANTP